MVQKHFQDLEQKELKAEKEEGMKLKRVAGQMAKMIKEFWANIEKVGLSSRAVYEWITHQGIVDSPFTKCGLDY